MSAAVVSGIAAAMLETRPTLTPDDVKTALVRTFRTVEDMGNEVAADQAAKAERQDRLLAGLVEPRELVRRGGNAAGELEHLLGAEPAGG